MKAFYAKVAANLLATAYGVVALWALAGCGPEPSESSDVPTCSDVWVVGKTLPAKYGGCMDGDSLVVSVSNSAGAVVYGDRLAAQPGSAVANVGGLG